MPVTNGPMTYDVDEGDPPVIRVVPGDIGPELSPNGTAMATLLVSGEHAVLNLGTRWWPSEAELNAVRNAVSAARERAASDFLVNADTVSDVTLTLVLTDGDAPPVELARSGTSNAAPFSAVLSADVGPHRDALQRALLGERGLLHARLEAELTRNRSVTTASTATAEHATDRPAGHATDRTEVRTTVNRTTTATQPEVVRIERHADVADWVRGSPARHVVVVDPQPGGGPDTSAGPGALSVRLGFDATGSPVDRVALSGGRGTADLTPGDAAVSVDADDALEVTTRYRAGAPYRVTLPHRDDGWTLRPADLGLVEVAVDAGRLRDAGATAVTVEVFYQPDDRGTPDRRTVAFEGGTWSAHWFVVSRSDGLAGGLRVKLREVVPEGVAAGPHTVDATTPTVRL